MFSKQINNSHFCFVLVLNNIERFIQENESIDDGLRPKN